MEARALLRQLDGALVACAARTEAGQDASASDMTSLASVVEALAKQLALQSSFAIYSSISAQVGLQACSPPPQRMLKCLLRLLLLQLSGWDEQQHLCRNILAHLRIWAAKPLGLDLLVQALPHKGPSRTNIYDQLVLLLQPQLNGPALSQTGDSPDQLAESELQGLSQQVCSEVQRLIFSDADGLPRCVSAMLEAAPHRKLWCPCSSVQLCMSSLVYLPGCLDRHPVHSNQLHQAALCS